MTPDPEATVAAGSPRDSFLWREARFQSLMAFRVREILLVSSAYDAFVLEEDGSLSDRLFYEYSELSLSWAPRMAHAATAERALAMLAERRIDLVITVVRVGSTDAGALSRSIRERHPDMPIVLLLFDEADVRHFPAGKPPSAIDRVFQWTGSAGVLIAAIKAIEDDRNVAHDTAEGGVQVILVVEDNVRAYSSFLGMMYPELLAQSNSLIAEGLNDYHRLMRMRARAKILLATSERQALQIFAAHRANISCVISDVRIPHEEGEPPQELLGIALGKAIRARDPELPILFQTAELNAADEVSALGAWLVHKNAPDFLAQLRRFLQDAVGFGDFVFRLPDRTEVARARDVYELERFLATVPAASVAYHAARHHFSMWLRARSLFELAKRVRPRILSDFDDVEGLRRDLIGVLSNARLREQQGVITDLAARSTGPENRFVRVGRGSIGGKGRGLAFVSHLIVRHDLLERFEGLEIRIPKTVVLGTDAFDAFMSQFDVNALLALESDHAVTSAILEGRFPEAVIRDLSKAFDNLRGPLAVRSSSLLEDSRFRPFAGVYATYMLPNRSANRDARFEELLDAIKAVYASVFWRDARTYLAGTPHDPEDQKMAVVIQQVVGRRHGSRFYPPVSGVAQSHNDYPVGGQRAEDGVAHLALGLGHTVVGGGVALRFSPGAPTILPQFPSAAAYLEGTQTTFYALDLDRSGMGMSDPEASLMLCDLADAERDGTLQLVASVYSAADDVIRENLAAAGPKVVTFNNILKWNSIPLAPALTQLLQLLREGMGGDVELELAVDIRPPGQSERAARLYVVQVRPMATHEQRGPLCDLTELADERLVCRTDTALGHGTYPELRDVVFVNATSLDAPRGRAIRARLRALNDRLVADARGYVLIGPGRWGTSDPSLGIGVSWADIHGARVIVETPIGSRRVEPSQGTHFFRNITAARVGYLTVTDRPGSWLDRDWLARAAGATTAQPGDARQEAARAEPAARVEGEAVHHLALDAPLTAAIDGRRGHAVIEKPEA